MNTCQTCGVEIPDGHEVVLRGDRKKDPNIVICSTCATQREQEYEAETQNPNLIGALLLGLVAAVVGSLIWYAVVVLTNCMAAILAIGVGVLVGLGVVFGSGNKRGVVLQVIAVVLTLLGMVFSEYLIVRHILVESYGSIPLFIPVDVMLELIVEGVKADLLTLLFWGAALVAAFFIPARRQLQRAKV